MTCQYVSIFYNFRRQMNKPKSLESLTNNLNINMSKQLEDKWRQILTIYNSQARKPKTSIPKIQKEKVYKTHFSLKKPLAKIKIQEISQNRVGIQNRELIVFQTALLSGMVKPHCFGQGMKIWNSMKGRLIVGLSSKATQIVRGISHLIEELLALEGNNYNKAFRIFKQTMVNLAFLLDQLGLNPVSINCSNSQPIFIMSKELTKSESVMNSLQQTLPPQISSQLTQICKCPFEQQSLSTSTLHDSDIQQLHDSDIEPLQQRDIETTQRLDNEHLGPKTMVDDSQNRDMRKVLVHQSVFYLPKGRSKPMKQCSHSKENYAINKIQSYELDNVSSLRSLIKSLTSLRLYRTQLTEVNISNGGLQKD